MNRRALLTGVATLAVWPMAIRSRPRRDVRVVEPREWFGEYIEGPTPITFKAWPGWEEGTIMHCTAGGQWEWRGKTWVAIYNSEEA